MRAQLSQPANPPAYYSEDALKPIAYTLRMSSLDLLISIQDDFSRAGPNFWNPRMPDSASPAVTFPRMTPTPPPVFGKMYQLANQLGFHPRPTISLLTELAALNMGTGLTQKEFQDRIGFRAQTSLHKDLLTVIGHNPGPKPQPLDPKHLLDSLRQLAPHLQLTTDKTIASTAFFPPDLRLCYFDYGHCRNLSAQEYLLWQNQNMFLRRHMAEGKSHCSRNLTLQDGNTYQLVICEGALEAKSGLSLALIKPNLLQHFRVTFNLHGSKLQITSIQAKGFPQNVRGAAAEFSKPFKDTFGVSAAQFLVLALSSWSRLAELSEVTTACGESNLWFRFHQSKVDPNEFARKRLEPLGFTLKEGTADNWHLPDSQDSLLGTVNRNTYFQKAVLELRRMLPELPAIFWTFST